MASSTTIDVDYEIDNEDGGMDTLDFQDIPHTNDVEKGKTHEFTNFPHSAVDSDDEGEEDSAKLLKEESKPASSSSFWTFSYYQQFFDVDTKQVGLRIVGSMLPKPGSNYLIKEIRPNPDLYGPFWICTTLVFTTAIAGNLANYFSSAGQNYHWHYDFHKVTFAATAIFSYWWLIPLVLFGLMWWQGYRERFTFLEMICVYGYSLAIYIPISVLWAIQVAWLQWLLVVLGAALSGSVLLMTFWPTVSEGNKKVAIGVMIFIFVMHAALAAGFVLYFFHVPVASSTSPSPITNSSSAAPLIKSSAVSPKENKQQQQIVQSKTNPINTIKSNNNNDNNGKANLPGKSADSANPVDSKDATNIFGDQTSVKKKKEAENVPSKTVDKVNPSNQNMNPGQVGEQQNVFQSAQSKQNQVA